MAIVERLSDDELSLVEILYNPVFFIEFINNVDLLESDRPYELTNYQKEFVLDFNGYVSICTARATGKTESIANLIIWLLICKVFPNDYIVYFVPGKAQLDPVWTRMIRVLRSNSLLKHFIHSNSGVNSSEFRITLLNQAVLLCRIAGQSGTGINVIGLHTPFVIVDEAGYFPWNVFMEMQPILNSFTSGYRMMVVGVPTGLRENNVLYYADQENSQYSKHWVSAYSNPRFSEKDRQFAIEQYGGEDSDDYTHYVLGKHGKPVFALFDRSLMEVQSYPVYKLFVDGLQLGDNLFELHNKISIFPGIEKNHDCIIGVDLGYTEPTAIVILTKNSYGQIRFHGRIQLTKVSYPVQEKLLDLLDNKFNPIYIGMDKGSAGISVLQHMHDDKEYAHKNYKKRLIPIDFSSSMVLGIDSNGEEIKEKTKPFSTSVLQDYTNNHKIIYSTTDLEMVTELERMTYSKTSSGEIVYKTLTPKGGKKGEDHFTSALLCASMAYYLSNDFILGKLQRVKLVSPSWLM